MSDTDRHSTCRFRAFNFLSRRRKILFGLVAIIMIALTIFLVCFFTIRGRATPQGTTFGPVVTITPQPVVFTTPFNKVDQAFVGLAIEERSLLYYAGMLPL